MARLVGFALFLLCLFYSSNLFGQEGRLQKVREEVRADDDDKPRKDGSHKKEKSSPAGDDGDDDCGMDGSLFLAGLLLPFAIPHVILEGDSDKTLYFPRHPYPAGLPGYMFSNDPADKGWRPPLYPTAIRLSLENGNDFAGLDRLNGQLLIDTVSRFGVQTSWNFFLENVGGGRTDHLQLGDVNLVYRFAQNEWATMRSGIGFRVLADHGADFGFNFTYGGDFFPVRPLVLSTLLDLGNAGSAFVLHARGSAGVILGAWEIFTGYDFFRIGSVNLQGPMLGVRFWY